jgi:crotonobetainyl-CoA:carnitine CoA-transferase CaiB-like acyl-CoA transferase
VNPGLIYCAISGYGRSGPFGDKGGLRPDRARHERLMSMTGEAGPSAGQGRFAGGRHQRRHPRRPRHLRRVRHKLQTGLGQVVDTSLFEAGLQQMYWPAAIYFADGTILPENGLGHFHQRALPGVPHEADGWINIGAANQANYERLVEALAVPQLKVRPTLSPAIPCAWSNRLALVEILNEVLVDPHHR